MAYSEITELFDDMLDLEDFEKHSKKIHRDLEKFKISWIQKNTDHTLYVSTQYTGVYNAVFSSGDTTNLLKIFRTSEKKLAEKINRLPDINEEWEVSKNPVYLLLVYLMHKFYSINYNKLDDILTIIYEIMSYKMTTSITFNFYNNKLTEDEAKAVYEKLSYRFLIKKLGSWEKVFKYKSDAVKKSKDGIHSKKINKLTTVYAMDVVAAIQTSYKSMFIYIAGISHSGNKTSIKSTDMVLTSEDGKDIRTLDNASNYITYIEGIITFKNDFIIKELVSIITKQMGNVDSGTVSKVLEYLSKNHIREQKYINMILEYSIEYLLTKDITDYKLNLDHIKLLKGFWSSGNKKLKDVKNHIKQSAYKATGRKTEWLLNSATIAVILYIFIRAVTKNKV